MNYLNITNVEQSAHSYLAGQLLSYGTAALFTPQNLLIAGIIIIVIGAIIKAAATPVSTIFLGVGAFMLIISIIMFMG